MAAFFSIPFSGTESNMTGKIYPAYDIIDTPEGISDLVDSFYGLPDDIPMLYLDLEGENLSRQGTISILQIYVLPRKHAYLIDICALGVHAFSSPGPTTGWTLKYVLESPDIAKVFFDVRNDSDGLFSHFGISLDGVQDIQLMEFASRTAQKSYVCGLAKCIDRDGLLNPDERQVWKNVKDTGHRLFDPARGGSYAVFGRRPLSQQITLYCIQDVHYLPRLWLLYDRKLTADRKSLVKKESQARVKLSQSADYNGQGGHMALPPAGWVS